MTPHRREAAHRLLAAPLPEERAPEERAPLLDVLASRLAAIHPGRRIFAAVDGVDGSGKTTFADALAAAVAAAPHHRSVVRISLDDFHHPRAVRHRRGRGSAEGFRCDSYNLEQFRAYVLDPLKPGGSGCYRPAGHDLETDAVLAPPPVPAPPAAVVLVDGLFLHRTRAIRTCAGTWVASCSTSPTPIRHCWRQWWWKTAIRSVPASLRAPMRTIAAGPPYPARIVLPQVEFPAGHLPGKFRKRSAPLRRCTCCGPVCAAALMHCSPQSPAGTAWRRTTCATPHRKEPP